MTRQAKASRMGKSFEYRTLYKLKETYPNAKRVPASGSATDFKGDIWAGDWLIECKKTSFDSFRIDKQLIEKVTKQAEQHNRLPVIMFGLKRMSPMVVMHLEDWIKLVKSNPQDKAGHSGT